MNILDSKIIDIATNDFSALIRLESRGEMFSALILDSTNLATNQSCKIAFKESEVMVCDKYYTKISARNRFISEVVKIECDCLFARIYFDFKGEIITALITKQAADELEIEAKKSFAWFVKSNEISIIFKEN